MCPFATRCAWAEPACTAGRPALRMVEPDRGTRCIRIDEIRGEMAELRTAVQASADPPTTVADRVPIVSVVDARKEFASRHRTVVALDGVSVDVAPGEGVGLVGESGSGKTTLGRAIAGLETLTAGTIHIDGIDASRLVAPLASRPAAAAGHRPDDLPGPVLVAEPQADHRLRVGRGDHGARAARARRQRQGGRAARLGGAGSALRPAQARRALRRPAPAGRHRACARRAAAAARSATSRSPPSMSRSRPRC